MLASFRSNLTSKVLGKVCRTGMVARCSAIFLSKGLSRKMNRWWFRCCLSLIGLENLIMTIW